MLALTGVTKRPKKEVENFFVNPARSILKEKATGYLFALVNHAILSNHIFQKAHVAANQNAHSNTI